MHKIPVALLDPHVMVRKAIANILQQTGLYEVTVEANYLDELADLFDKQPPPTMVLLDVLLPKTNGYEAIDWLQKHHPAIKVVVLSSIKTNYAVSKMADSGASAFVSKSEEPDRLLNSLTKIQEPEFDAGGIDGLLVQKLVPATFKNKKQYVRFSLTAQEVRFMQYACSNHTYAYIATKLGISENAIEKLRGKIFEKLDVKNRSELCLFTMSNGISCHEIES